MDGVLEYKLLNKIEKCVYVVFFLSYIRVRREKEIQTMIFHFIIQNFQRIESSLT